MNYQTNRLRIGVYVDTTFVYENGGARTQYDILRDFACRDDGVPIRLNAYVAFDEERAAADADYAKRTKAFHAALRSFGYKVIVKIMKWQTNEDNVRWGTASADMDLAVDALLQSKNLDRVVLVAGDEGFTRIVQALQNRGCRVEVVAFDNVSQSLRDEADFYVSGHLLPNLLKPHDPNTDWGVEGSIVRGTCYYFNEERGFGYMRYIKRVSSALWQSNPNGGQDPAYGTAFFHYSNLVDPSIQYELPNSELIFEFRLEKSTRQSDGLVAADIHLLLD